MTTIDQVIAEKIGSWMIGEWPIGNLVLCVIALILSSLLCGIVGIERERRGRSAGLRTHLLVGVGSCLIMIISIYGFPQITINGLTLSRDVARLAAQVVTGVGFLGAGAIIHRNSGIRGLTTAATIWIVMAIGLACGSMNFILAIVGTGIIMFVLTAVRKFETRLNKKSPLISVRVSKQGTFISELLALAQKYGCTILDLQVELCDNGEVQATFLAVSNNSEFVTNDFLAEIEHLKDVVQVGIINGHKL